MYLHYAGKHGKIIDARRMYQGNTPGYATCAYAFHTRRSSLFSTATRKGPVFVHNTILFGPVTSRRLGRSLGVNLVSAKTCSLDCVYCECGCTQELTMQRKEYVSTDAVIAALDAFLSAGPRLDFVTFGGDGEPTLHTGLGTIASWCARSHPSYRRALLTNATLFDRHDVRQDAMHFDVVLPSLDAVTREVFETVNRPAPGVSIDRIIDGLQRFSRSFTGQLWIELFILPGINDSEDHLTAVKRVMQDIGPTLIQLNRLARPPAYSWVQRADDATMQRIADTLAPLPVVIL